MTRYARTALVLLVALPVIAPVLLPVVSAALSPGAWRAWAEADRIAGLTGNTAALAALACLVAVPAGTAVALAAERVPFRGRGVVRALVLVGLFVPLPVYAVAWQVVLGAWLPPLRLAPGQVAWRPWSVGLVPAAWVHGMAGLPWVAWVVGAGLRAADRGLEEDALLTGGPRAVFRWVLLPRAAVAAVVAAGWVAAQTATEIPVTDAMMVRTFAEEAYTRFVSGGVGLAGAVAVTVPVWLAAILAASWAARSIARRFGNTPAEAGEPVSLRLDRGARWGTAVGVWAVAGLFAGLPLAALAWKAGGGGTREGWAAAALAGQLAKVARSDGGVLLGSVAVAVVAGVIAAGLAWVACWAASGRRSGGRVLLVLCVALWLTPGPVVGFGLMDAIRHLLDAEDWVFARLGAAPEFPPLRSLLYDQPSAVPGGWAAVVRFFPVAVAVIWPAVRAVPRDLLDAAKLDGVGVTGEWRLVVAPLTGTAAVRAAVAVAALALGEVSASKIVNPPGHAAYVLQLFDQMHYGSESTVAGLCLLQVAATILIGGVLLWLTTARR